MTLSRADRVKLAAGIAAIVVAIIVTVAALRQTASARMSPDYAPSWGKGSGTEVGSRARNR